MGKVDIVKIPLKDRGYNIHIGNDQFKDIGWELKRLTSPSQAILITSDNIFTLYGQMVLTSLKKAGIQVLVQKIPDGEHYKSWDMAGKILENMLEAKINRDAVLVALGGGVIGDLAGFVASVYQRGIRFVQIPTTLLAQVDSSVGGKVAVNHPLGKNMIGSFYQPIGVWIDLTTLDTLPPREWQAGLAEVIKYGAIWDRDFFNFIEENISSISNKENTTIKQVVKRCCEIKGEIVARDEREQSLRAILNFGHTIGHALESITEYQQYRHGEAVAIGMSLAAKLSVDLNAFDIEEARRLEAVLSYLGLPTRLPASISVEKLVELLQLDKKVKDKKVVFILLKQLGQAEIIKGINLEYLKKFLANDLIWEDNYA